MGELVHGVFDNPDKKEDKKSEGGSYMEELLKKCPHRFYFLEGKRNEVKLNFSNAATMYTAAYDAASKEKLSCAIRYKWMAMRCVEYDGIYQDLLKQQEKAGGKGRKPLNDTTVLTHYSLENDVIPHDVFKKAKDKIPLGFPYTLVSWDKLDNTVKFIHVSGFFLDSEPKVDRAYTVFESGNMVQQVYNPDPDLILDKWMVTDGRFPSFDMNTSIRRSIRVRYLNLPKPLQMCMHKKSVWEKYVAPCIGNRHIGHLYHDFVKAVTA